VATKSAEERFESIAESELRVPGVTAGTGFGNNPGLRVGAKIFAMVVRGELVVKLPKGRVDELVAAGVARRFDAGKGRPMKEWASVDVTASRRWGALVREARSFVGSG
jgi:TfoX/Sxy family transcriptional regulator of competence genes